MSRSQALGCGLTDSGLAAQVRARRWTRLHAGAYATFTGPPPREAVLWAAVLACGDGATLSHQSALEVAGAGPESPLVHVSVPAYRRVRAPEGVRVHYSIRLAAARHPTACPPRTTVEEAVVDVVNEAVTATVVIDTLTRVCQRRLTTADRLVVAAGRRKKLRWRALVADVLSGVTDGAQSPLELTYLRRVERAHRLPPSVGQLAGRAGARRLWRDRAYVKFRLLVELDGAAAHPAEDRHRDYSRDNSALEDGWASVRYGWHDCAGSACQAAGQVGRILQQLGWDGRPAPCRPGCPVQSR